LSPKYDMAWVGRANCYAAMREDDKALAAFAVAVQNPTSPADPCVGLEARIRFYIGREQWDKVLADKAEMVRKSPRSHQLRIQLAMMLLECRDPALRDPRRAVELAREAVQLKPDEDGSRVVLGQAHYRAGEWKEAVAALTPL